MGATGTPGTYDAGPAAGFGPHRPRQGASPVLSVWAVWQRPLRGPKHKTCPNRWQRQPAGAGCAFLPAPCKRGQQNKKHHRVPPPRPHCNRSPATRNTGRGLWPRALAKTAFFVNCPAVGPPIPKYPPPKRIYLCVARRAVASPRAPAGAARPQSALYANNDHPAALRGLAAGQGCAIRPHTANAPHPGKSPHRAGFCGPPFPARQFLCPHSPAGCPCTTARCQMGDFSIYGNLSLFR